MRRLIYITILVLITGFTKAQVNLDSLWKIWSNEKQPDTVRLKAMKLISHDGYLFNIPDSAYYYAQLMYELAEKKGLKKYMGLALQTQGSSFYIKGLIPQAIDHYTRSMKLYEEAGNKLGISNTLNNLANIYSDKGDFAKAIEYYTRSLTLAEEIKDKKGIAVALSNIGILHNEHNNKEKAKDYFLRSLKICEEIGDIKNYITGVLNLGAYYHETHQYEKALEYYFKALNRSREIGDKNKIAACLVNVGAIYIDLGDHNKATETFVECLALSKEADDKNYQMLCYDNFAALYGKEGNYKKAIEYFTLSLKMAQETNYMTGIINSSENLFKTYCHLKQYKEALNMHKFFIQMQDSLLSEENQNEVMRQEMQYTYEKQKAIDEKDRENQIVIATEKKQKQKVITYAAAVGLILVLLFSAFIYTRLRISDRQKKIIEEQKHTVEEKQKEILDSITYAKRLQDAILPPENLVKQHLPNSFIYYQPKDIVAGDFYWMEVISEQSMVGDKQLRTESKLPTDTANCILIAAADCTGHGVPGALVSVVCSNALNRSVKEFGLTEPGKILDKTRELVLETFSKSDKDVKDGMDISLCSIEKTNSGTSTVKWAGANNPLWYLQNGEIKEITANKQAIGKTDKPQPFTTHTLELQKGDSLFLFTDGYADQFGGPTGKKFMYKAFKDLLVQNHKLGPDELKQKLQNSFNDWKKDVEQIDDICVIGISI